MNKPPIEIVTKFVTLKSKVVTMGERVLELNRHPEATPEQLFEAATAYRNVHAALHQANGKLIEKYPAGHYPWLTNRR